MKGRILECFLFGATKIDMIRSGNYDYCINITYKVKIWCILDGET